jgi:hypothetical protein
MLELAFAKRHNDLEVAASSNGIPEDKQKTTAFILSQLPKHVRRVDD